MTKNIVTMVSNKEYKEGWDRIFGGNIWKCPACGKVVDYGDSKPSKGRSLCYMTGKTVRMVRVLGGKSDATV